MVDKSPCCAVQGPQALRCSSARTKPGCPLSSGAWAAFPRLVRHPGSAAHSSPSVHSRVVLQAKTWAEPMEALPRQSPANLHQGISLLSPASCPCRCPSSDQPYLLISASYDGTVKVWDARSTVRALHFSLWWWHLSWCRCLCLVAPCCTLSPAEHGQGSQSVPILSPLCSAGASAFCRGAPKEQGEKEGLQLALVLALEGSRAF